MTHLFPRLSHQKLLPRCKNRRVPRPRPGARRDEMILVECTGVVWRTYFFNPPTYFFDPPPIKKIGGPFLKLY